MEIKLLNSQDFASLNMWAPEGRSIHVWLLPAMDIDNLHKNSHKKVRKILSHYINTPEKNLSIRTKKHGKPYLADLPDGKKLYFNLSHSGQYMALAVSTYSPVGIDIENMNRMVDIDRLARRFFHPIEVQYLNTLKNTEKKEAFFRLWTIKESFLKGLGDGLTTNPSSFYAHSSDNDLFDIIPSDDCLKNKYASWHLISIPAPDGYICTAAYQRL